MKRQSVQVEFFPLVVPGKTLVPRRTKTPCFTGAHDASKNALGNCSRLVPGRSELENSPTVSGSSQPGTTLRGGTLVPTPVGGNRELRPENAPELSLLGVPSMAPRPLAPAGFGYDWRGRLVDLRGLRPGEDGRPPIFVSPKPEGLQ
jgi:hypothetical protein